MLTQLSVEEKPSVTRAENARPQYSAQYKQRGGRESLHIIVTFEMYTRNLFGKFLTDIHCSKEKRKHEHQKKEGEKRAAHNVALLKNKRATPTSLLLIKRSGTPPSLAIREWHSRAALERVPLLYTLDTSI